MLASWYDSNSDVTELIGTLGKEKGKGKGDRLASTIDLIIIYLFSLHDDLKIIISDAKVQKKRKINKTHLVLRTHFG